MWACTVGFKYKLFCEYVDYLYSYILITDQIKRNIIHIAYYVSSNCENSIMLIYCKNVNIYDTRNCLFVRKALPLSCYAHNST